MKISLGCDEAAYQLKETIKQLNKKASLFKKRITPKILNNSRCMNVIQTTIDTNHYLKKMHEQIKSISAASLKDFRPSSCFAHVIKLIGPTLPPIRQKMRRITHSKRGEFKQMLDEMLAAHQIRPSDSSWASTYACLKT